MDERRTIASQQSAVGAAQANTQSQAAAIDRAAAAVEEAQANVLSAKAELDREQAELGYTTNNFHRIEPLLAKQFVTVDQVDQARTAVTARQQAVDQAKSQLSLAQAQVLSAKAQYEQSKANMQQSRQQLAQSQHSVLTLEPLTAQREGKAAAIRTAEYNLNNARIYAPFDARVTNLTISQGAYAHTGQQVFTLIDTRVWWVVANFPRDAVAAHQAGGCTPMYTCCRVPTFAMTALSTALATACSRIRRWWVRWAGAAGCAALAELGAPGDAIPGARAHSRRRRSRSG